MEVINVRFVSEGKAGRIYVGAKSTLLPSGDREVLMTTHPTEDLTNAVWEPATFLMEMMYNLQFTI